MSGHVSVMGEEAVAALDVREGGVYVDATFGAGGYTDRILRAGGRVFAFDRDGTAIEAGRALAHAHEDSLTLIEAPFDRMAEALAALGVDAVDGIVFDLGVSSMQLDQAERGFSFLRDGPLDMRMGEGRMGEGMTAAAFVNEADEADIADVLFQYGEEKRSRRLAAAICEDRQERPFETTGDLAGLAERVLGKQGKTHPATRAFQAVRILLNDELGQVVRALVAAERLLRAGGRLVVVAFHSLEDRIVKRFVAAASGAAESRSRHQPVAEGEPATLLPIKKRAPSDAEIGANRRARSARMRVAERTDAPPRDWPVSALRGLGAPGLVFSPLQKEWAS